LVVFLKRKTILKQILDLHSFQNAYNRVSQLNRRQLVDGEHSSSELI